MSEALHISSLLLRADPARLDDVIAELASYPGTEVALSDPSGKVIVTLETESEAVIVERLNTLSLIDGVVSAALVFHQREESAAQAAATGG